MYKRGEELLRTDTQKISLQEVIRAGIMLCRDDHWDTGLALLRKATRKKQREIPFPSLYYSYLGYGLARFDRKYKDGLSLCKHAVRIDDLEPENYLNLARIYLLREDRRNAVAALQKGLMLDSNQHQILELRRELGFRKRPVVSFLSRSHFVNRWLGRRRHRKTKRRRSEI
jgi:tetratricopeptide (TPR) repeat protein